jgi:putative transposase
MRTRSLFHVEEWVSDSKLKQRESTIWQRRFWEHQIRTEEQYQAYMDYIHYNPVKHGLVERVRDWPHSTFHRYVKLGVYYEHWGGGIVGACGHQFGDQVGGGVASPVLLHHRAYGSVHGGS